MSKREMRDLQNNTYFAKRFKKDTLLQSPTFMSPLSSKPDDKIRKRSKIMTSTNNKTKANSSSSSFSSIERPTGVSLELNATDFLHRHNAVLLLWKIFGMPNEKEWKQGGLIAHVVKALNVPHGSYGSIVTILRGAITEDTNVAYKTLEKVSSGPVSSIIDGSPEAKIVYKC